MPTVKKLKKDRQSWRSKRRHEAYKLPAWRELSKFMRMSHPLCAICGGAAEHVHHILSPFRPGLTNAKKLELLLDPLNLVCLCAKCHSDLHNGKAALPAGLLDEILSGRYYGDWEENLKKIGP